MWRNFVDLLKRFTRFIKMCAVGLGGMLLQLGVFNVLRHLLRPEYANLISIECAIVLNFLMHNVITFRDRRIKNARKRRWLAKFGQFNVLAFGSMLVQTVTLMVGVDFFGRGLWVENGLVLVGILLGAVVNYFTFSRLVWRDN